MRHPRTLENYRRLTRCSFALLLGLAFCQTGKADPCGMVPPIYTGNGTAIARTGLQQTYVFYHKGIESFVIRPGFTGKVDNFGMLIPFPNPPAIRKVSDYVFSHIKNAIDPPEVVVDLRMRGGGFGGGGGGVFGGGRQRGRKLAEKAPDRLEVLNKEAVGMYEVAVLSAGSAKALKKWMDENKFQYPEGMDAVTNDYVKLGWCFVAVKTRVGEKSSADPKPGQRNIKPGMQAGATFDGSVQGLGFRFKSKELVVPMRLSAFNEGDMRNLVYLLTNGAKRIRSIPEEYIVRQVSGRQLVDNLTQPVPLRIIGGKLRDIPASRRASIKAQRQPEQYNEIAKALFASDIFAAERIKAIESLSLKHEQENKELLAIGEHFGLRGKDYDSLLEKKMNADSAKFFEMTVRSLNKMTLTVVDGDFPRDVIARENLRFDSFHMARSRNSAKYYDANEYGPVKQKNGKLFSSVDPWQHLEHSPANLPFRLSDSQVIGGASSVSKAAKIGFFGFAVLLLPYSVVRKLRRQKS